MTTAAGLIIGDEILTGKVRDTNTPLLVDFLRDLGVSLQRLVFIGDEPEEIATEVRAASDRFDAVITSGGVGPTHDDRTVAAVAQAFGVGVVRDPEVAEMIRAWWGDRFTEAALRMADMPEGARLLYSGDGLLPLPVYSNVYMLPGIPRLFAAKLGALRGELEGEPIVQHNLYLRSDESMVAPLLQRVDEEFPEVKIGSYPRVEEEDHRLWITVEATSGDRVGEATARLLELLPSDDVVRVED